ncbi:hypothetical protein [Alteromonas sp. a30]|uniref:hypothetical protein n=1 Tax=Alteromonas sp. a30 TaxID=2730917 RepID=UPI00227EE143|nr:hypothetical protein [Alteromonas sp. a30]MCY7296340.1 hypothetical protein [Alteromonas sp. a30]
MDFDKLAYPETIYIDGVEHKGKRNVSKGELRIPYSNEPDVGIGDIIVQKSGKREIDLKVIDVSFLESGSLNVGTKHPHMLTLKVENATAQEHISTNQSSTINIGSVSGEQVQVGNHNSQISNISIQTLVDHVVKNGDDEAKSTLKTLLQNSSVASLVGAGASALLGSL